MSKMHPQAVYERACTLLDAGSSIATVARLTGIPRSTVGYWRRTPGARRRTIDPSPDWRTPDPRSYSYLLGLYLGDGTVIRFPRGRTCALRLYLDRAYVGIVEQAARAIGAVMPATRVRRYTYVQGVTILHATAPDWLAAFPQHGPGKKHLRPIVLEPWQEKLTREHPRDLIRGLIHSDGSRCVNRFRTKLPSGRIAHYAYPRYFFTNYSADIREIFCRHCELVGIRWTQSSFKNISVAHRDSVALLDQFVGPKA